MKSRLKGLTTSHVNILHKGTSNRPTTIEFNSHKDDVFMNNKTEGEKVTG